MGCFHSVAVWLCGGVPRGLWETWRRQGQAWELLLAFLSWSAPRAIPLLTCSCCSPAPERPWAPGSDGLASATSFLFFPNKKSCSRLCQGHVTLAPAKPLTLVMTLSEPLATFDKAIMSYPVVLEIGLCGNFKVLPLFVR